MSEDVDIPIDVKDRFNSWGYVTNYLYYLRVYYINISFLCGFGLLG